MRRLLVITVSVVLTLVLAVPTVVAAQPEPQPGELHLDEIDFADYPEVRVTLSVPQELVGVDLDETNFAVTEAGAARVVAVAPIPTDGLQVVLAVDTSGSMRGEPMSAAQRAAQGFLDRMPPGVEVAVVAFASESRVASPMGPDLAAAARAVGDLDTGGETALYDGLSAAAQLFSTTGGHRALVLLSDGGDTVSVTSIETALIDLVGTEARFYAIELQSPEVDSAALARLAVAAAGVVVPATDPAVLDGVFADIASQIVNRYTLTYESAAGGETAVIVTVESDGVVATASRSVRFPDPPHVPTPSAEPGPAAPVTVAATPSTAPGTVVTLAWWQQSRSIWIGAAAMFVALAALALSLERRESRPIDTDLDLAGVDVRYRPEPTRIERLARRATAIAERATGATPGSALGRRLERAGIYLRAGEFAVLALAIALTMAAVGMAFAGPIAALLAGGVALFAISSWLDQKAVNRQAAFANQLADVLQLMAGSVRAGFGLSQAIDVIGQEVGPPAGEEFKRVRVETQLGRDTNEALLAMASRVANDDFKWVVEAVEIHRDVGGDFADILASVTATVRTRNRMRRRIRALSAEGRITGLILALLPFALAVVVSVINPGYLAELVTTFAGRVLIVAGIALLAIGGLWMRRITTAQY